MKMLLNACEWKIAHFGGTPDRIKIAKIGRLNTWTRHNCKIINQNNCLITDFIEKGKF